MADQQTIQQNKATSERFFREVFNEQNYDNLDEILTANTLNRSPPGADEDLTGREAARAYFIELHEAWSDLRADVKTMVAEGEYVANHVVYTGTHDGEFMGIPATGESVEVEGIVMYRFEDGKIAETFGQIDAVGLMEQVGAL